MKIKTGLCFISLLFANAAVAAPADDCLKMFPPAFQKDLGSAAVNYKSPTLADDITRLLSPTFEKILASDANCIQAKKDLLARQSASFSLEAPEVIIDFELQFGTAATTMQASLEFESVMPWYGILVVKKGSLDEYVQQDLPVIPTEYMKENYAKFWPDNSAGASAWNPIPTVVNMFGGNQASGCTYGSHTANDNDVVNRAAHVTFDEQDSFFSGNDYYVYDGKDVYWGWASLAGEVALAIVTFGSSSAITAGRAAANATRAAAAITRANTAVRGISAVRTATIVNDVDKVNDAVRALKAVRAGNAASKTEAITKAREAGIVFRSANPRVTTLNNVGNALETSSRFTRASVGAGLRTAWTSGFFKPWKLMSRGATAINPRRIVTSTPQINRLTGIKRGIATGAIAAGEVGIGLALMKAYGYSAASIDLADNVKFSAFGLLSADDLDGRDNEVSHGAWIQVDEINEAQEGDRLKEVLAFAEEFKSDIDTFNTGGECDIDIYVVQVGISNPDKLGKREAYYWLYTEPARDQLRVNGK